MTINRRDFIKTQAIATAAATLKKELIYRLPLYKMDRKAVRQCVFEWIEGYYNRRRRHTSNENNMAPLVKREMFISKTQTVA